MIPEAITTQSNKLTTIQQPQEALDMSDFLISRLQLQQPLSKLVTEGKALPGEIVDSVSGEVLCKKGQSLEVIPLKMFKEWHVLHLVNNAWEFQGKVPFNTTTATYPKETVTAEGVQVRNDIAMNWFVLLKGKEQDFPMLLSFKRSSYYAGRKMYTAVEKAKMLNRGVDASMFTIKSELQTFEKFTFFVLTADKAGETTAEQRAQSKVWIERLGQAQAKVEIHEDGEETPF